MLNSTVLLGVPFNINSKEEILEEITSRLKEEHQKTFIVTPNPELVMLAHYNKHYQKILNSAQVSLPDGVGIVWASRILSKGIQTRIAGVDFVKSLVKHVAKQPVTIGLFGAGEGVAEEAAECLRKMYPEAQIVYASHLPPFETDTYANRKPVIEKQIDILFVALGSPKQEEWIYNHLDQLPVKVVMGVGGAFDMISGRVRRAPRAMQTIGLEWLWRLITQPWRWRRQLRLIEFVWLVVKEKVRLTYHR